MGYFLIVASEVNARFYIAPRSDLYVNYSIARKKLLRETFLIEAVQISPGSVFTGHGYVQHAGGERRGEHCTRYHSLLIPENIDLQNGIAFVFDGSVASEAEKHSMPVQNGLL